MDAENAQNTQITCAGKLLYQLCAESWKKKTLKIFRVMYLDTGEMLWRSDDISTEIHLIHSSEGYDVDSLNI